jgi:protein-histidine pros-kinase
MTTDTTNVRLLGEAAEERFREFLESAPDAIVVVSDQGLIVFANHQAEVVFGYDRRDLLGQPLDLLIPSRFHQAHRQHCAGYNAAPRTRPMGTGLSLFARRRDGSEFPVEISLSPAATAAGHVVTSIIRDVSERMRLLDAERRARAEVERQKDEFIANVSHDLRTPLTAIKASIGVVLANEPSGIPMPLHRMLVNIENAADRMANLVSDLLELSRLQAGRVQLRLMWTDLAAVARRSARTIEPLLQSKNQRLEIELPETPCFTRADPERLERALLNLLGNAQKYGKDHGLIRLMLRADEDAIVFAVTDDGPGIATDEQARIFNRFYRSEGEATRLNQGSGLGLPIARAMVELHHGRIWVESTPGHGATFSIALPLVASDGLPARKDATI